MIETKLNIIFGASIPIILFAINYIMVRINNLNNFKAINSAKIIGYMTLTQVVLFSLVLLLYLKHSNLISKILKKLSI